MCLDNATPTTTPTMASRDEKAVDNAARDALFSALLRKTGNRSCFDCASPCPKWTSKNFGVFVCLDCSGIHRSLGVHVSMVKSANMDRWTEAELDVFRVTKGNDRARTFFSKHGWNSAERGRIGQKYTSRAAMMYAREIAKEVEAMRVNGETEGPTSPRSPRVPAEEDDFFKMAEKEAAVKPQAQQPPAAKPAAVEVEKPATTVVKQPLPSKPRSSIFGKRPMMSLPKTKTLPQTAARPTPTKPIEQPVQEAPEEAEELAEEAAPSPPPPVVERSPVVKSPAPTTVSQVHVKTSNVGRSADGHVTILNKSFSSSSTQKEKSAPSGTYKPNYYTNPDPRYGLHNTQGGASQSQASSGYSSSMYGGPSTDRYGSQSSSLPDPVDDFDIDLSRMRLKQEVKNVATRSVNAFKNIASNIYDELQR